MLILGTFFQSLSPFCHLLDIFVTFLSPSSLRHTKKGRITSLKKKVNFERKKFYFFPFFSARKGDQKAIFPPMVKKKEQMASHMAFSQYKRGSDGAGILTREVYPCFLAIPVARNM